MPAPRTTPPVREDIETLARESRWVDALARRLVGDGHLAEDVAQETWVQAIRAESNTVHSLRAVLGRIVRNVAAGMHRRENLRREHERERARRGGPDPMQPSAEDMVLRVEQQKLLAEAVLKLEEPYRRTILQRFFEGVPQREIARREGIPSTTVNSRLTRAIAMLRHRLDRNHGGDRQAWILALTPLLPHPVLSQPTPVTLTHGAWIMTSKSKITACILVIVAAVSLLLPFALGVFDAPISTGTQGSPAPKVLTSSGAGSGEITARSPSGRDVARAPLREAPLVTTGELVVRARFGSDGSPAVGVWVIVGIPNNRLTDAARRRTDATGTARFQGLPPRNYAISSDRGFGHATARVRADEETVADVELPVGITIRGIVVEAANGLPVAGALVEMPPLSYLMPNTVATTGSDGRFILRDAPKDCVVAARAAGFAACDRVRLRGDLRDSVDVRLELERPGCVVEGTVRATDGSPIADAVVRVGAWSRQSQYMEKPPPFVAYVRTDESGSFAAVGIPEGEQPVAVLAPEFAPWKGEWEVWQGRTPPMHIVLVRGARVRGTVLDSLGGPAVGAQVNIVGVDSLAIRQTRAGADGTYELSGLPLGELEIRALNTRRGKASRRVSTQSDVAVTCDLQLSRGLVLNGRVVDSDGQGIPGVNIQCREEPATRSSWARSGTTDGQGCFSVAHCPEGARLTVTAFSPAIEKSEKKHVRPEAGELTLVAQRIAAESVRISGRVLDASGRPLPRAKVRIHRRNVILSSRSSESGPDGRFELGPLRPGSWSLSILVDSFAEYSVKDRRLSSDATWDLGDIRLESGGSAVLKIVGAKGRKLEFQVWNPDGSPTMGCELEDGVLRTRPLVPGDYQLSLFGAGIAAVGTRFAIREGEVTELDVKVVSGVPVPIEITVPNGEDARWVHIYVLRDGVRVLREYVGRTDRNSYAAELTLAPGLYEVLASIDSLRARAPVTVSKAGNPTLKLVLTDR